MTSPVLWSLICRPARARPVRHRLPPRADRAAALAALRSRHELKLHGARNLAYAALFLTLGLIELHGFWAMLVIAVLAGGARHHAHRLRRGGREPQVAGDRARHPHAPGDQLRRHPRAFSFRSSPAGPPSRPRSCRPGTASAACSRRWRLLGVIVFGLRDFFAARRAERLVLGDCGRAGQGAAGPAARAHHRRDRLHRAAGWSRRWRAPAMRSPCWRAIPPRPRTCGRRSGWSPASTRSPATRRSIPSSISPASRSPTGFGRGAKRRRILASRLRMTRAVVRLIGGSSGARRC